MAKASSAPKVEVVRFVRPYPHIESITTSYVFTGKVGRHCAYEVTKVEHGVELRKDGKLTFVPWTMVQQIEYSDG